jgi:hypothetical protein
MRLGMPGLPARRRESEVLWPCVTAHRAGQRCRAALVAGQSPYTTGCTGR